VKLEGSRDLGHGKKNVTKVELFRDLGLLFCLCGLYIQFLSPFLSLRDVHFSEFLTRIVCSLCDDDDDDDDDDTDNHLDILNVFSLEPTPGLPRNKNVLNFCIESSNIYRFCVQIKKKLHLYEYNGKYNFLKVRTLKDISLVHSFSHFHTHKKRITEVSDRSRKYAYQSCRCNLNGLKSTSFSPSNRNINYSTLTPASSFRSFAMKAPLACAFSPLRRFFFVRTVRRHPHPFTEQLTSPLLPPSNSISVFITWFDHFEFRFGSLCQHGSGCYTQ
jgi:hypothetical protein